MGYGGCDCETGNCDWHTVGDDRIVVVVTSVSNNNTYIKDTVHLEDCIISIGTIQLSSLLSSSSSNNNNNNNSNKTTTTTRY